MQIRLTYTYRVPTGSESDAIADLALDAAMSLEKALKNSFYESPVRSFSKVELCGGIWCRDITDVVHSG
jgi:hypothetical protein